MYSEPHQTPKKKRFEKNVGGLWVIFAKYSVLDIWQGSEYAFGCCINKLFFPVTQLTLS